jgi:hypothetical protein
MNEKIKKSHRKYRKKGEGQGPQTGLMVFEQEIQRDQKQRVEEETVFQSEPGKKAEEKPAENELERRKRGPATDLPEDEEAEESDGNFGVEMDGIEKDRSAECIDRPQAKGKPLSFPALAGIEIDLNTQERGPEGEARFEDKGEPSAGKELAQPVERQHEDGYPGQVDRVNSALFFALAAVDPQPQSGVVFL